MYEEFDLDVRRSALQKSVEKLQEKFARLRKLTFKGLMFQSIYLTFKREPYKIVEEMLGGCFTFEYYRYDGVNKVIRDYKAESFDKVKLCEDFRDLEDYYSQTLTLLSDRNQELCSEFEKQLIAFRTDMLRLQTDIAFIIRRNMIDEVEEQGMITLDNIASGQNLLTASEDLSEEELFYDCTSTENDSDIKKNDGKIEIDDTKRE